MIKALADKVMVQEMKREKSKGGLIIPDSVQEPQAYGTVLSIGEKVESPIQVGDVVVFHQNGGMTLMVEGKFLRCVMENELYGLVESNEIIEQLSMLEMKQSDMDKIAEAEGKAREAAGGSRIVRV